MSKYGITYTISMEAGKQTYDKATDEIHSVLTSCGFKKEQPETFFVIDSDKDTLDEVLKKVRSAIDEKAKTFNKYVKIIYAFEIIDYRNITSLIKKTNSYGFDITTSH
jgi:virulence-associated protein VapD